MKVMIVGGGKPVYFLCRAYLSKGHDVTLVNRDREECERMARLLRATVVLGDGTDPRVLEQAECGSADALLAVTPNDHDNLAVCQLASRHFGVARVVGLVHDPDNEAVFNRLGVSAFSTTVVVANLLEQRADLEEITNLIPAAGGRVSITEVKLTAESPAAGHAVRDLTMPPGTLIAVVMRGQSVTVPRGDAVIEAGDTVVLVALPESQGELLRLFAGER